MATFRRAVTPGATYFFTVNTYRRQARLTDPPVVSALREALWAVKRAHRFTIDAFVLLPDHLHCLWTLPEGDADYALRWNLVKRRVSGQVRHLIATDLTSSRSKRRELGLWQRRFWEHQIRDDLDFAKHVDYVRWNPVKHGYVIRVADWPYSSFHRYVTRGLYPLTWASHAEDDAGRYGEAL
ncbi:MAG: REP-associated tyrosine transposase [Gammaproteobacteria bacterium]